MSSPSDPIASPGPNGVDPVAPRRPARRVIGVSLRFQFHCIEPGRSNWHAQLRRSGIGAVTCAECEQGDAVPNYMLLLYAPRG